MVGNNKERVLFVIDKNLFYIGQVLSNDDFDKLSMIIIYSNIKENNILRLSKNSLIMVIKLNNWKFIILRMTMML